MSAFAPLSVDLQLSRTTSEVRQHFSSTEIMFWSVTVYDIDTRSQMRTYLGDRAEAIDATSQALSEEGGECGYDAATSVKCCGPRRRRLLPNMWLPARDKAFILSHSHLQSATEWAPDPQTACLRRGVRNSIVRKSGRRTCNSFDQTSISFSRKFNSPKPAHLWRTLLFRLGCGRLTARTTAWCQASRTSAPRIGCSRG